MAGFLAKRIFWALITIWIVYTATFALMKVIPGGPLTRERKLEPEIEENFKRKWNLDKPVIVQYFNGLKDLVRGDLGYSMKIGDYRVIDIIKEGFPISASLGALALTFALVLGVTAGIISAVRRHTIADGSLMALATLGMAVPDFIIASIAQILFVFVIPLFPAAGWGTLQQLVLPSICLGLPYAAYIARLTRTGLLDVLSLDYVRTAQAKGLSGHAVIFRHAVWGAMLPVVSFLGPATAGILTGSLVVERIFGIPGLGIHFVEAASQADTTLSMGLTLLYTVMLTTMNILVDIAYALIDPRVKLN